MDESVQVPNERGGDETVSYDEDPETNAERKDNERESIVSRMRSLFEKGEEKSTENDSDLTSANKNVLQSDECELEDEQLEIDKDTETNNVCDEITSEIYHVQNNCRAFNEIKTDNFVFNEDVGDNDVIIDGHEEVGHDHEQPLNMNEDKDNTAEDVSEVKENENEENNLPSGNKSKFNRLSRYFENLSKGVIESSSESLSSHGHQKIVDEFNSGEEFFTDDDDNPIQDLGKPSKLNSAVNKLSPYFENNTLCNDTSKENLGENEPDDVSIETQHNKNEECFTNETGESECLKNREVGDSERDEIAENLLSTEHLVIYGVTIDETGDEQDKLLQNESDTKTDAESNDEIDNEDLQSSTYVACVNTITDTPVDSDNDDDDIDAQLLKNDSSVLAEFDNNSKWETSIKQTVENTKMNEYADNIVDGDCNESSKPYFVRKAQVHESQEDDNNVQETEEKKSMSYANQGYDVSETFEDVETEEVIDKNSPLSRSVQTKDTDSSEDENTTEEIIKRTSLYSRPAPPPPVSNLIDDSDVEDAAGDNDEEVIEDNSSAYDFIFPAFRIRSSSDSVLTGGSLSDRISSLQAAGAGAGAGGGEAPPSHATLQRNKSALHSTQGALGGSMTSLTSAPPTPTPASSLSTSDLSERPRVSHGKPNLAPKPPTLGAAPAVDTRPSPPPKKLLMNGKIASRTQSMRVPRSPPVSPPDGAPQAGSRPTQLPPAPFNPQIGTKNPASHFGTLRAPRGLRPPGVCPPPPPGAPPPPPARHASLAAPPPPPPHHRQHSNVSTDEVCAPAPPVRGSSMRAELEARFGELFNPASSFPPPDAFLRRAKGYSSTTQSAKAQAPLPPLQVPLDGWSGTSSAC